MLYITGDTHGTMDIAKLYPKSFREAKRLTKDDYLIIAGDTGIDWDRSERNRLLKKFYDEQNYTTLFIDGNHENFDLLNSYPVTEWNGGKVHRISDSIIHLMRGQIYEIDGKKIFTFGGGLSIDKENRLPRISWWEEEWPSYAEIEEAMDNLDKYNWSVDYVVTHAAPESVVRNEINAIHPMLKADCKTEKFLQELLPRLSYERWFCGHYHIDAYIRSVKMEVLYQNIIKCSAGWPIANRNF